MKLLYVVSTPTSTRPSPCRRRRRRWRRLRVRRRPQDHKSLDLITPSWNKWSCFTHFSAFKNSKSKRKSTFLFFHGELWSDLYFIRNIFITNRVSFLIVKYWTSFFLLFWEWNWLEKALTAIKSILFFSTKKVLNETKRSRIRRREIFLPWIYKDLAN